MKRARLIAGAAVAALLAGFSFTACVNESPEINYQVEYTHKSDFTEVLNAINSQTTTIADKIAAVEAAIKNGTATLQEASKALKEAIVKSLDNQTTTLADKIAGVTSAVNSQALTLKDKLEILDKTIADGVLTLEEASKAMKEALVAELKDQTKTLDEKLADVKTAIDDQTIALSDKIDILTAAVDNQTVTLDEALKAIDESVQDQTERFEAKFDLINSTIETGAADIKTAINRFKKTMKAAIEAGVEKLDQAIADMRDALATSIDNQTITIEEGLAAVEEAIDDQTTMLETQLGLINKTIEKGCTDIKTAIKNFKKVMKAAIEAGVEKLDQAIADMRDALATAIDDQTITLEEGLAAVEEAIDDQTTMLETQLDLINTTIETGAADIKTAIKSFKKVMKAAIEAGVTTLETAIDDLCEALYTAITEQTVSLEDGLEAVATAVDDQTIVIKRQLKLIRAALEDTTQSDAIISALGDIKTAVEGIDSKEALEEIAESIADLTSAVENLDIDNTGIIEAIDALELTVTVTGGGSSDPSNPGDNTDTPDNPGTLEDGVWYKLDDYTAYASEYTAQNFASGAKEKIRTISTPAVFGPDDEITNEDTRYPYFQWTGGSHAAGIVSVSMARDDQSDDVLFTYTEDGVTYARIYKKINTFSVSTKSGYVHSSSFISDALVNGLYDSVYRSIHLDSSSNFYTARIDLLYQGDIDIDNPDTLEDGVWYKLDEYTVYANVNTANNTTNYTIGTKIEHFSNPKVVGPGETISGLDADFPYLTWTAGSKKVTEGIPDMNDKVLSVAAVGRVAESTTYYKKVTTVNGIVFCRKYAATFSITPAMTDGYYASGANYGIDATTYAPSSNGSFIMSLEDQNSVHFIVDTRN
ncbi:MAG: hypothetical protein MJY86_08000 [Bacteroidales bacterium]|nr:hypothetical protein [Bacteroidales bacterium]